MLAVEYLGNKCNLCGYNKCFAALEFHHKDGQKKDFGLASRGLTRSWETIKRELEKCVLVCSNCHKEIHNGVVQLPPETTVEKLGELRETKICRLIDGHGNPEPSSFVRLAGYT